MSKHATARFLSLLFPILLWVLVSLFKYADVHSTISNEIEHHHKEAMSDLSDHLVAQRKIFKQLGVKL